MVKGNLSVGPFRGAGHDKELRHLFGIQVLLYGRIGGRPEGANIKSTSSDSTSLRVCSTVFGGLYASSSDISSVSFPSPRPFSFTILK